MPESKSFKIVTYNIEYAAQREKILRNIIQLLKEGADMFCLQELINTPNETFFLTTILQHLGDSWEAVYHVGSEDGRLSLGNAIVWNTKKFTMLSHEKILLPMIKKFDINERLWYKTIGVAGIPIQRRAVSCLFTFDRTDFRVTTVHIDNVGGPIHRMKQITFLLETLRSLKTPPYAIICGDFNTFDLLKTGYEKKILQRELGNDFIDASDKIDWTSDLHMIDFQTSIKLLPWFVKLFNVHVRRKLDYIWVKNFTVRECNKREIPGSDHYPIIAKLELP